MTTRSSPGPTRRALPGVWWRVEVPSQGVLSRVPNPSSYQVVPLQCGPVEVDTEAANLRSSIVPIQVW